MLIKIRYSTKEGVFIEFSRPSTLSQKKEMKVLKKSNHFAYFLTGGNYIKDI
jgi:hypothetical protein